MIGTSETSTPVTETPASAPPVFQILTIRPVTTEQEIPIHHFEADGAPVYTDKVNGHFIWDVDPDMCDADCECRSCHKQEKMSCKPATSYRKPKDPHSSWIGLKPIKNKPLPIYDRALQILRKEGLLRDQPTVPAPIPCFMASSYDKDFPPLDSSSNPERNLFSRPFIQSTEVLPDGSHKQPSQAEQVLNWHTLNSTVQNRVLHSIDQKIDKVSHQVSQQDNQLQHLDSTLRNMYTDLQSRVSRHRRLRSPDHSQFFKSTGDLFRKYPPLPTEKPSTSKERKTSQKKKTHSSHKYSPPNYQKQAFYTSPHQHYSSNTSSTETETSEPSSTSSWETYHSDQTPNSSNCSDPDDLTQVFLATRADPQPSNQTMNTSSESETTEVPSPVTDEPPDQRDQRDTAQTYTPSPKPTNGPWFNFDEVAPRQWRKRMSEMSAWLDLQIAKGGDNVESIMREFVSRFTGSLRDWYQALGEYRQLQLVRCGSVSIATGIIFREFLRDVSQFYKQTRQDFFKMTVCSLNKEDIDYHYRRMFFRYHALGGVNDETLRQVYLNSLPSELQGELQRLIEFSGKSLREITLGEIHMFTHTALEKLCATQRVFSKMIKEGKKYSRHCKFPPNYHLKCNSDEHCNCKANRPYRKRTHKTQNPKGFSRSRKYKYYRKKARRQLRQVAEEIPSDADIESYFSEQEDVNQLTSFMMLDSDDTSSSGDSSLPEQDYPSEAYQATNKENAGPQIKIQILPTKYSKPVPVIAYFDTGAHSSMMNPNVLPADA
ncbi:hypothetical protein Ddye_016424 [Dipteronia dyeriana]|uniref:Uncharacterized protein n=1 Tax=Dipteronia dyeriana TaxID=168575 RepID=A0AAD9U6S0_9ROSI|nr:hypothetical protein Ddye_016424 [Dipteronia dyeriana]